MLAWTFCTSLCPSACRQTSTVCRCSFQQTISDVHVFVRQCLQKACTLLHRRWWTHTAELSWSELLCPPHRQHEQTWGQLVSGLLPVFVSSSAPQRLHSTVPLFLFPCCCFGPHRANLQSGFRVLFSASFCNLISACCVPVVFLFSAAGHTTTAQLKLKETKQERMWDVEGFRLTCWIPWNTLSLICCGSELFKKIFCVYLCYGCPNFPPKLKHELQDESTPCCIAVYCYNVK